MEKLLILDGNSVLHRAYYALPDWRNRAGEATSGVYGFLNILHKAILELNPTHLVIMFDNPAPTFRHHMYVGYQSNREKDRQVSEDIWGQVEKLKEVFGRLEVPVFCVSGFEADDLAGTVSKQAEDAGMDVVIITGDKDYMQLVSERVNLYMPVKGVTDAAIVDRNKVKEKLGVWPEQVIDLKALTGDSSDNYPGVPGIGPKSATDLISNYSNYSNIYKNLDNIKDNVKKKLTEGYESGQLSYRLATIRRDVPVKYEKEKSVIPDVQKMIEVFASMGYKSLVKRMGGPSDSGQGMLLEEFERT
jgi:DNA polymerase-1